MKFFSIKQLRKDLQKIAKSFFQFLFLILYGKISKVIDAKTADNVKIFEISKNKITYKVYFVKNARLYTDRIDDTAIITQNKIIEGPSYQLRADIKNKSLQKDNSKAFDNIVIRKGTPRIKKRIKGKVLSLLSGGGANDNFFHWLYDVLPRLALFDELKEEDSPKYILVPNYDQLFQKQTLDLLGFDKKRILSSKNFRHIECEEIIVTDHPYNVTNNTIVDNEKIPQWISEWLKLKFLKKKTKSNDIIKRVYIDRDDEDPKRLSHRRIINEEDLRSFLKQKNFTFVKLSKLHFSEQIEIFNNAEIIIGLHGAGFGNLPFCKPNTKILEFRTKETGKILENIALTNKLNFHTLEVVPKEFASQQHGLIEVSIEELRKIILDF